MEFSIKVTTSSADCQLWMSQGVLCVYGFQREEGIQCFERALSHDSHCAMAHYFIAYCNAANYNDPDGLNYCVGFKETQKAFELSQNSSLSEWEGALLKHRSIVFAILLAPSLCQNSTRILLKL